MGSLRIVFTVFLKAALVVGAVLGLFGCSAPAAVTVAGIAADGASYAASGKSLGDQALSIASGQNCSTLGMLKEGVLCHAGVAPALVDLRNEVPPFAAVPSAPAAPPLDNSEAVFLALGVFPDWENADHAVVLGRFYNPLIVPLDTDAKGKDSP